MRGRVDEEKIRVKGERLRVEEVGESVCVRGKGMRGRGVRVEGEGWKGSESESGIEGFTVDDSIWMTKYGREMDDLED